MFDLARSGHVYSRISNPTVAVLEERIAGLEGGIVVDSGRFDWDGSGKFKTLTEPYAGILNIDFAEDFGPDAFLHRALYRSQK